jgi:hypothetical protein
MITERICRLLELKVGKQAPETSHLICNQRDVDMWNVGTRFRAGREWRGLQV